MNVMLNEPLLAAMRAIDAECMRALAPQFSGYNTVPIGSQWDYDAAIAQSRLNFERYLATDDFAARSTV